MLLDEEEKEARLQERASIARAFKTMREEAVEKRREQDRLDRNAAKERQLQEAEEMQVFMSNLFVIRRFLPFWFVLRKICDIVFKQNEQTENGMIFRR